MFSETINRLKWDISAWLAGEKPIAWEESYAGAEDSPPQVSCVPPLNSIMSAFSKFPQTALQSTSLDEALFAAKKWAGTRSCKGWCPNVAIFSDHNWAYYFWQRSKEEHETGLGSVLIHFDAHEDMRLKS